jgi:hypothetical protein
MRKTITSHAQLTPPEPAPAAPASTPLLAFTPAACRSYLYPSLPPHCTPPDTCTPLPPAPGNIDRCRTLYEKYLEWAPSNCAAWIKFAELEKMLGEAERARAIYELAISQPLLDMPEALWKSYIDFEIEWVAQPEACSVAAVHACSVAKCCWCVESARVSGACVGRCCLLVVRCLA